MKQPFAKPQRTRVAQRLLELTIEIAIAVALVIGIVAYAFYVPNESRIGAKWVAFALNTVFIFATALKQMRPLWTRPRLWGVSAVLVLLHVTIGAVMLSRVERIPLIWYAPFDLAEIQGVLLVFSWTFAENELQQCIHATRTKEP